MISDEKERHQWFSREILPLEPSLRAHAVRFCHSGHNEVGDLVHDTFARLITCTGWRDINDVPAFAHRVLRNVGLTEIRRRKIVSIEAFANMDAINIADEIPSSERVVGGREELLRLSKLIETLPTQCRRVVTMKKIYDLSHAEIAAQLGLSVSTVEKHLRKGLKLCSAGLAKVPVDTGRLGADVDRSGQASRADTGRGGGLDRLPFRFRD